MLLKKKRRPEKHERNFGGVRKAEGERGERERKGRPRKNQESPRREFLRGEAGHVGASTAESRSERFRRKKDKSDSHFILSFFSPPVPVALPSTALRSTCAPGCKTCRTHPSALRKPPRTSHARAPSRQTLSVACDPLTPLSTFLHPHSMTMSDAVVPQSHAANAAAAAAFGKLEEKRERREVFEAEKSREGCNSFSKMALLLSKPS